MLEHAHEMIADPEADDHYWAMVKRYEELLGSPDACREADEWVSGSMDSATYCEAESALADLDDFEPDALLESHLLTRLYRLAKTFGGARKRRLREMAEYQIEKEAESMKDYADRRLVSKD